MGKKIEKFMDSDILNKEITKEKNEGIYIQLIEKFNNGIYSKRPNPIGEKLVIIRLSNISSPRIRETTSFLS